MNAPRTRNERLHVRILIACECSGVVRRAFCDLGHNVISCDLQQADDDSPYHYRGPVQDMLSNSGDWDLLIAHPPCTYLTVTANKWLKDQPPRKSGALVGADRRQAREKAAAFFMMFVDYLKENPGCKGAIENPVGCMSTRFRKPDQIICPTMFGHPEPKKTCLWLTGLPLLVPTKKVEPDYHTTKSGKRLPRWCAYADKKSDRSKIRSQTFAGIAAAMADQWGNML